jgi:toxin-antitoxin system PIN domain toxin
MILIDANLLLYASDAASVHHEAARHWLETTLSEPEPVGLSWVALLAFLRVGTNPRLRKDAPTVEEAEAIVAGWLERPMVTLVNPSERHWQILRDMMTNGQARGPLVTDAHLAALAIEHGATLATTDRDFARFPGLKFFNPLDKL